MRRKRRGSNPHLQNRVGPPLRVPIPDFRLGAPDSPRWLSRCDTSSPRRYRTRGRRLTPEQEVAIQSLAATRSLRSLASEFGVSHETIRALLQHGGLVLAVRGLAGKNLRAHHSGTTSATSCSCGAVESKRRKTSGSP